MEPSEGSRGRGNPTTMSRLKEQLDWYEKNKNHSRNVYHVLKALQIVAAAMIPVLTSTQVTDSVNWIVGALGAFVVATEGIQQLGRYHDNWLRFAQAEEALKRENHLYLVGAGEYVNSENPDRLLAERLEDTISHETGAWATSEVKGESSAAEG
jgi:hypothetical protein